MNFLGNVFTAGKNKVVDAVQKGEQIHFLQSTDGAAFMHRTLSPAQRKFATVDKAVSYAGSCWFFGDGLLELFGEHFEVRNA